MDVGVVLQTDPPASAVVERAVAAEAAGFSHVWTFDSVVLWQEPFVIFSQILARTERVTVGPMVTNPVTRDWSVTASLFATLNSMFGPRTVCGIGRGDSAVRVIGGRPATLGMLRDSVIAIRDLANGRAVQADGKEVAIPWASDTGIEVWVAAYGPKALAVAGSVGDGLILQLADPYLVEWSIKTARDAAAAAGRDPDSLKVCVAAPAYIGTDLAHQRDQVRWFGGMVGNHVADLVARYGAQSGSVPAALTDYIAGRHGYDYAHHGRAGNPSTDFVPDDVIDRFCLLGPAPAHVARLQELAALGADQFALYLMHDQAGPTLEAYGRDVIPAVAGPG
ncbi:TIGR03842 family LLM class F420-dependent oxidoreductase [Acidiferrimicrobium sp. IK]|uniref:TIGR03842 family LLM class F420-dependent oxidoreductase n=1 Tax=Acidiferrimicrobium sp. IK TaxID=2871700 RepID=UPI003967AD18|nr:TIGR03842 family LLM class F420-dependent oxidoreductase [Acidiferrimicrobium sp. IK]